MGGRLSRVEWRRSGHAGRDNKRIGTRARVSDRAFFGYGARSPLPLGSLTSLTPSPSVNPTVSHPRGCVRRCVCTLKPQALPFAMLPAPVEPLKDCAVVSAPVVSLSLGACHHSSSHRLRPIKHRRAALLVPILALLRVDRTSLIFPVFCLSLVDVYTPTPPRVVCSLDGGATLLYCVAGRCSLPPCIPSLCIFVCSVCFRCPSPVLCGPWPQSLSLPSSLMFCLCLRLFLSCSCVAQSRSALSRDHGCLSICGRVRLLEAALVRYGGYRCRQSGKAAEPPRAAPRVAVLLCLCVLLAVPQSSRMVAVATSTVTPAAHLAPGPFLPDPLSLQHRRRPRRLIF